MEQVGRDFDLSQTDRKLVQEFLALFLGVIKENTHLDRHVENFSYEDHEVRVSCDGIACEKLLKNGEEVAHELM